MGRCGRPDHLQDARVHCAVLKQRTVTPIPPTTRPHRPPGPCDPDQTTSDVTGIGALHETTTHPRPHPADGGRRAGPFPQDPTACLPPATPGHHVPHPPRTPGVRIMKRYLRRQQATGRTGQRSTLELHPDHPPAPGNRAPVTDRAWPWTTRIPPGGHHGRPVLLRKEVIQPHLPVRLPCYDFVPIADPAFDGSLPQGVGPPASGVTDFRDVTGGVYKARERIHRSVADLRLLATPTSWGRVADPNPN